MPLPSIHESSHAEPSTEGSAGEPTRRTPGTPAETTQLFPLGLTPFERYMWVEDRPAYSMSFVVVSELDGRADETAMRRAIHAALQRHPLLTAQLVRRALRTKWVGTASEPTIVWHDSVAVSTPVAVPDPARGSGALFQISCNESQTSLHFHFHHAVTDGIGAVQFIGDVLALYGQQTAKPELRPRLLPLDLETLKQRHLFDIRIPFPVSRTDAWRAMWTESWKVFSVRPSVLRCGCGQRPSNPTPVDDPGDPRLIIQGEDLENYAEVASGCDVTVNDLLLRDLFLAMRQWNASQGDAGARQWLRATVPTSLRYRKAIRMPAANMIGYAFLTHRAEECDAPSTLLSSLHEEMKAVTQWGLGSFFVRAIEIADSIPGLLWAASRMNRRFSTIVFSNVGEVSRRFRARFPVEDGRIVAGNLTLRNIYGTPPVRPGTRLAFGVTSYDQQMTFVVRYDRRHFTAASAADFLKMFRQQTAHTTATQDSVSRRMD